MFSSKKIIAFFAFVIKAAYFKKFVIIIIVIKKKLAIPLKKIKILILFKTCKKLFYKSD